MSKCISCGEPLDYPSGDGCAAMTKHKEHGLVRQERLDEALAKLDKAVEALRFLIEATTVPEANICITRALADARAVLAELEGEKG